MFIVFSEWATFCFHSCQILQFIEEFFIFNASLLKGLAFDCYFCLRGISKFQLLVYLVSFILLLAPLAVPLLLFKQFQYFLNEFVSELIFSVLYLNFPVEAIVWDCSNDSINISKFATYMLLTNLYKFFMQFTITFSHFCCYFE